MGSSSLIDILGSIVIGGMLLMTLLNMNGNAIQNNYDFNGERIVQQNIVEVVSLLEYDFRKIGYCSDYTQIPDPAVAIFHADSTSLYYLTDIPTTANPFGDGVVDTVKYYLGSVNDATGTPNPNDRVLYRVVNHNPALGASLGVTRFKLTYFDVNGTQIATMPATPPFGIAAIQIDVAVENPVAYGSNYSYDRRAIWRQVRMASRNFMLR